MKRIKIDAIDLTTSAFDISMKYQLDHFQLINGYLSTNFDKDPIIDYCTRLVYSLYLWWIIAAIDLMTSVFDISENINGVITLSISTTPQNRLGLWLCHSLRQDILRLSPAFL